MSLLLHPAIVFIMAIAVVVILRVLRVYLAQHS